MDLYSPASTVKPDKCGIASNAVETSCALTVLLVATVDKGETYVRTSRRKKVDHRRRTMRLLEERFERERVKNELRYANLEAFVKIQDEQLTATRALLGRLVDRVEQLEVEVKVHPLKKMLGIKAK